LKANEVEEKISRIKATILICGIDIGKTKSWARFCDYRGMEVYRRIWF